MLGLQLDLLNQPRFPRARRSDVTSSHEAAAELERTGLAGRQAQAVLEAIKLYPGGTAMEIAWKSGLSRYVLGRRCPELAALGLVLRVEPTRDSRPCTVSGKRAIRWLPA